MADFVVQATTFTSSCIPTLTISGGDDAFVEEMLRVTDAMMPYKPSMKLDFDTHRPMEIPYLYTRGISEACKAGFEM